MRTPTDLISRSRSRYKNPTLYSRLQHAFGRIEVSRQGDPAVWGSPRADRRGRLVGNLVDPGEYYRVDCAYCHDTRKRLYVNHLWGTPDPVTGDPLHGLAICYNADCLKEHYREFRDAIVEPIWRDMRAASRSMRLSSPSVHDPEALPLGPVPLPGEVVPIDQLPPDHHAARYLRDRGFDLAALASAWGVGFCLSADDKHRHAAQRIFVPFVFKGERVGWQCRWPNDRYKAIGVEKYYNLKGFRKSRVLYGHDAAQEFPYVIIVEGVTDAWAVGDGAVALAGKTISESHYELLAAWAESDGLCVLMLDAGAWTTEQPDAARAREKHAAVLARLGSVFAGRVVEVVLEGGRDPGSYDRDSIRRIVCRAVNDDGHDPDLYGLEE
jgi:hypothetical protein